MNTLRLGAYALATALAFGGMWIAAKQDASPDRSDGVVLLPGEPEGVATVSYTSERAEVTLRRRRDEHGQYLWASVTPIDGEEPGADAPTEPGRAPVTAQEFKAGAVADRLVEGLAPFTAKRAIEVPEEELEALGLAEPEGQLVIERTGKEPKTFDLGSSVYGGAGHYIRDPQTGTVYVIDAGLVRPLENAAQTLPDWSLHATEIADVQAVTVESGQQRLTFEQHNPDDFQARYWTRAGEATADPQAMAWMDRVLRLRATRYLSPEEAPENLDPVFRYVVRGSDGTATAVEVLRAPSEAPPAPSPAEGEATAPTGGTKWYARSPHTRGLVELPASVAEETLAELQAFSS